MWIPWITTTLQIAIHLPPAIMAGGQGTAAVIRVIHLTGVEPGLLLHFTGLMAARTMSESHPRATVPPLHEVVGPAHPHAHVGQAAHAPKAEGGHLRGAIPAPRYVRAGPRNDDECRPVHRVLIRVLRTVHPRTSENTDVLDASAATAGARRNLVTNTTVRDTRPVIHHPPVRRALRAATRQK